MSKSTKIIAALGVVAGLGVAALPAFTYATETVKGDVDVFVEVPEAIAMTITGNNDRGDHKETGSSTVYSSINIFNDGTRDEGTVDSHIVDDGTSASGANIKTSNGVDGTDPTLTESVKNSSSYVKLLQNTSVHGTETASAAGEGFMSTITVYTNAAYGYTLGLSNWGALTNTVGSTTTTIPGDGIVKAGHSGWGYAVDTAVSTDATGDPLEANYAHADNSAIKTRSTATSGGEITKVFYGVSTSADQAAGLYKKTITYTATTNNS